MRKLMWFAIGFTVACVVGTYLLSGSQLLVMAVATVTAMGGAWLLCRHYGRKPVPVVVMCGIVAGLLWYWCFDSYYLRPASELDGNTTFATIEVLDYSFETDYGVAADGKANWQGRDYRIRFYLDEKLTLLPGDIVSGNFRFRITQQGLEDATYHRGNGIALLAYESSDVTIVQSGAPWWQYPAAHIRHYLIQRIQELFPADTEVFARALLLGDDNDIGYEQNTAFKVTGTRHMIAVSGLHVSVLFGLIYMLSGKKRVLTALLGIPVLILFAAVAGMTPSVIRACVMQGLMILAMLLEREYDPLTALSFAGLTMMVVNPLVITSVSFQLSVGCMMGTFLFAHRIKSWLLEDKHLGHAKGKDLRSRCIRFIAGSLSVSCGAIMITTPLSAMYFGTVSLISPVMNLLTLWIVTFSFYGIMATCLLGLLWSGGAAVIAWMVSWPIRYIQDISVLAAKIPCAAVYTKSIYIVGWIVFCYVILTVFLMMKNKKPLLLSCIVAIGLCVSLIASWLPSMMDPFCMTVLDVGQGQSIILQGEGKTYVVDCGGSDLDDAADMTAETLLSMGIHRIDGLILTHYDADHAGGAEMLLSRIQADALFLPNWNDEDQIGASLQSYGQGEVYVIDRDLEVIWLDTKITIIGSEFQDSGNESSLCVLFQSGNYDILITGDRSTLGEKLLMQRLELPKLDVLVVGHHGSKTSTSQELLDITQPKVAVISVEKDNRYGHPNQEILDRLTAIGCQIYRTDRDGTIIIRG